MTADTPARIEIYCGPHREPRRGRLDEPVAWAERVGNRGGRMWLLTGRGAGVDAAWLTQEGYGAPVAEGRAGIGTVPGPDGEPLVVVVRGDGAVARRTVLPCPRKRCRESLTFASEDELYAILDGLAEHGETRVSLGGLRFARDERKKAGHGKMR